MQVHLVDGTYELFRYFYSPGGGHENAAGEQVGAVRGVMRSLATMLDDGATHLGVATDHVIESFRNDLWPGYKTGEGVEPALLAHLLGVDARGFILDGHLLGQLLESFVVAQLRPLLDLGEVRIEMTHLRDRGGEHEVDIILESPAGEVVGVEVKAAPRAEPRDAKHLSWLRDQFKTKFVRGVVLTTGVVAESLGDRLISLPISAIWTPEALA